MNTILIDIYRKNEKENIIQKCKNFFLKKTEYIYSPDLKFVNISLNEKTIASIIKSENKNSNFLYNIYIS
jgi:hypothetical protein